MYVLWRLAPTTLASFVNFPIKRIIDIFEAKWNATQMSNLDMKLLNKSTW